MDAAPIPTPFAALLQQYMWKRREPPISAGRFASEIGLNRQTILNWLRGARPSADLLPRVAEKLGVPLVDVYRAAGYPPPAELERPALAVLEMLRQRVEQDTRLTVRERDVLLRYIAEMQHDEAALPKAAGASHPKARRPTMTRLTPRI